MELYIEEPYEGTSSGPSGADSIGTRSYSFTINGATPDFDFDAVALSPGDTLEYVMSASASAGPGSADFARLFLETNINGDLYPDFENYDEITLVFDYDWSWSSTFTRHPSPDGAAFSSLLLGYNAVGEEGEQFTDINYADIGLPDVDDTYNIGIGSHLHDGLPHDLDFAGTGQIQLTFTTDESYVDISFYNEPEAYAAMDAIPESLFSILRSLHRAYSAPPPSAIRTARLQTYCADETRRAR
jgi:hypothetical protein|tara:strand:- start:257 stop:985 length:729 start_codon:yes stop_codon:yes gene_type:complete